MPATARARAASVPPIRGRTSILPAAAVLLLAVGTLLVFTLLNVLLGAGTTTPTTTPVVVGGLPSDAAAARAVFAGWVAGGEPPANVVSALVAPVGARRLGAVDTGGGGPASGDYDLEVRVVVGASRAAVLGFYRSHLEAAGWRSISTTGSATGAAELLFQKGGTDGFYWEAGVTAHATSTSATAYTLRLFQVSDYS